MFLRQFEEAHREEIETITRVLAKITSLPSEEITPHLHIMLAELVKPKERPLHEATASKKRSFNSKQWESDMQELVERGAMTPVLPEEAFTRSSIYGKHD